MLVHSTLKKIILIILLVMPAYFVQAQAQYEISADPKHPEVKVLRGFINKYLVQNDTSFHWYKPNQRYYTPDSSTLNVLEQSKGKFQFVVFGGTWCEDTQVIVPQFFKLQEMSGVPDSLITFFGVNRKKKSLEGIAEAFGITNVPTIIVMKNGKEIGRVVEYGKKGQWDKELAEIIRQ
ncbi:MAG: thioredoxin family protein [Sphingobacteriales bacterium]|nr:thioredoxin family protein [Sphingobacteriales bacterium]